LGGRERQFHVTVPLRPRPIRRAYEQVYDQLREGMLTGSLSNGERLPAEQELARAFGVSRATVRDALRLLHGEGLVRTDKGARGGSFVTLPTLSYVSEFLERNIELLSLKDDVTLEEFLEARELLEVFAVRQAAIRHDDTDLEALRATLTPDMEDLAPHSQNARNRRFHILLVDACGNSLLRIATLPIFTVLHTHLERSSLAPDFPVKVRDGHGPIIDAIQRGDPDGAAGLMVEHLAWLSGIYRDIWRDAGKESSGLAASAVDGRTKPPPG
jgi:GntR family transcriptional repressor for pyruvate dehydrogenase complex